MPGAGVNSRLAHPLQPFQLVELSEHSIRKERFVPLENADEAMSGLGADCGGKAGIKHVTVKY